MKSCFSKLQNKNALAMLAILLIGVGLRFYQINFGQPYLYHPDEIKLVAQAGRLLDAKFMDKEVFFAIGVYPPFFTYMLAIADVFYIAGGFVIGLFHSLSDVALAYQTNPFPFFLVGRILVAFLGTFSLFYFFKIVARLYSSRMAFIASLLLAINFVHVRNSHFSTVDVPSSFFALLAFYFIVLLMKEPEAKNYIGGAIAIALAVATKYSLFTLVFPFLLAHCAVHCGGRKWLQSFLDRRFVVAVLVGIIVFLIAFPLLILDFHETLGGIVGTKNFEQVGKIGSGGSLLSYWTGRQAEGFGVFYPNSIPSTFGVLLTVLAVLGLVIMIVRHSKSDLLVLAFIIPTYLLFEHMSIKAIRHLLGIIPFLVLASGLGLDWLVNRLIRSMRMRNMAMAIVLCGIFFWNVRKDVHYFQALAAPDPRSQCISWLEEQRIDPQQKFAVELFPPPVSRKFPDNPVDQLDLMKRSEIFAEFTQLLQSQKADYYISDDFTRQIFTWPYTVTRYPNLVADRQQFFNWIRKHFIKVAEFKPQEAKIQPTIVVYQRKQQNSMTGNAGATIR